MINEENLEIEGGECTAQNEAAEVTQPVAEETPTVAEQPENIEQGEEQPVAEPTAHSEAVQPESVAPEAAENTTQPVNEQGTVTYSEAAAQQQYWQPTAEVQYGAMPPQNAYYAPQQPVQGYYQPVPPQYQPYQCGQPTPPAQGQYAPPCPPTPPQQYYQPAPQAQPQGYYYPQPPFGYAPPAPPKKKMPLGLKVFIWVASILVGIAVIGFSSFIIYSEMYDTQVSHTYTVPDIKDYYDFDDDDEDEYEDDVPDFDDGVETPEVEDEPVLPDVDVTPNNDGITVKGKPEGDELSAEQVYDKVVKSTVTVAVTLKNNGAEQTSTGTGIIATSDGYIITNSHVVLNSKSSVVEITTYDGEKYEAVVVGMDRSTDLAVLKTNDHNFTPAEFGDSELLVIGESVVAIGNPGGEKFSGSMTGGYVSGLNREVGRYSANGMTYIQTDAAINPGNSGGPLVNMYGQVVGINSSKIVTDGYEGMGFAIPITKAKDVVDVLLAGGYVEGRTRLGITGSEISEMQSAIYGYPRGFMILEIDEESAFTGTAAEEGDVITAIDGEVVTGLTDISNLLTRYAPGDEVEITLNRNGKELTVTATLLEDKGETQK